MTRYIEAEKLENIISDGLNSGKFGHDAVEILSEIYALESADVSPVVHARWRWNGKHYECTNCGRDRLHDLVLGLDAAYCSYCGAKMDLEE